MKKIITFFLSFILIFTSLNISTLAAIPSEDEIIFGDMPVGISEKDLNLIGKMDQIINDSKAAAEAIGHRVDTGGGYVDGNGDFIDPTEKLSEEEFLQLQDLSEKLEIDYFSIATPNDMPIIAYRIPVFLAPLVIAVIRQAVIHLGKKQLMKNFTKHALQRGGERRIKETWIANTIANGQKFVDKETGAKILWDKATGTTLVMTKDAKTVTTMYRQASAKKIWKSGEF